MGSKIQTEEWPKKNCFRDSRQVTSQRISRCWFNDFCWWFLSFFRPPERINCQVTRPVFHNHIEGTPVDPPYPLTWLDMLKLLCRASIFELSHPKPIETSLVTLVYSFVPIMSLSYIRIRICYIYIYIRIIYHFWYIYIYTRYIIQYTIISLYKHTLCIHYIYILYINLLSLSCPPLNSSVAPESRGPPCALRGQRRGRSAQRGEGLGEGARLSAFDHWETKKSVPIINIL